MDDFNIEVEKINKAREEMFKKTIQKVQEETKSTKAGSKKRAQIKGKTDLTSMLSMSDGRKSNALDSQQEISVINPQESQILS